MPSDAIALLSHRSPDSTVAYRGAVPVTAGRFLQHAGWLAERLPAGRHVLNLCGNRYRFAVGLAACLMSGRVSLLPSTHTPGVIQQLAEFAADAFCLTDDPTFEAALPRMLMSEPPEPTPPLWNVPRIAARQLAAVVFTSGSTGTPLPHRKTWGSLAHYIGTLARRLGLDDGRPHTLIGTVPPQHLFGFESTVLLALLSGNALAAERPFFPADIAAAILRAPRPRVLISTPVHLHTLLASAVDVPPLDLVMSATAPLAPELARSVERTFETRLLEIYGSTETGPIAMRRTAESPLWNLWPDVRLQIERAGVIAHGGHIEQPTPLEDVIEMHGDTAFLLHGRSTDMINIAGKRSSFGYLNSVLKAIPGVIDGAFFWRKRDAVDASGSARLTPSSDTPSSDTPGSARLTAVVVAPGLKAAAVIQALRRRIDPVFVPRPLILVDTLPRNATGKLPHHALQSLADQHSKTEGVA